MRLFLNWCRSLWAAAAPITTVMWIGIIVILFVRWAQGSIVPFHSRADIVYRVSAFILVPVVSGLLYALIAEVLARMGVWRKHPKQRHRNAS